MALAAGIATFSPVAASANTSAEYFRARITDSTVPALLVVTRFAVEHHRWLMKITAERKRREIDPTIQAATASAVASGLFQ